MRNGKVQHHDSLGIHSDDKMWANRVKSLGYAIRKKIGGMTWGGIQIMEPDRRLRTQCGTSENCAVHTFHYMETTVRTGAPTPLPDSRATEMREELAGILWNAMERVGRDACRTSERMMEIIRGKDSEIRNERQKGETKKKPGRYKLKWVRLTTKKLRRKKGIQTAVMQSLAATGLGLVAVEAANKNERVATIEGVRIGPREAQDRGTENITKIGKDTYLDSSDSDGAKYKGRYARRGELVGCDSNARVGRLKELVMDWDTGRGRVPIWATKKIKSGEEIVIE